MLVLFTQVENWKPNDGESVWAAVEKCAARDGSVHEWPAARVREWASARGGQIAKKFKEAKDIDGAALMRLRTVEDFKKALNMNGIQRKNLMTAMRSSFARFELPAAVLDGVLRASLRVDVCERAEEIGGDFGRP